MQSSPVIGAAGTALIAQFLALAVAAAASGVFVWRWGVRRGLPSDSWAAPNGRKALLGLGACGGAALVAAALALSVVSPSSDTDLLLDALLLTGLIGALASVAISPSARLVGASVASFSLTLVAVAMASPLWDAINGGDQYFRGTNLVLLAIVLTAGAGIVETVVLSRVSGRGRPRSPN